MENIIDNEPQVNEHLKLAQVCSELALSQPDDYLAIRRSEMSKHALSLVDYNVVENISSESLYLTETPNTVDQNYELPNPDSQLSDQDSSELTVARIDELMARVNELLDSKKDIEYKIPETSKTLELIDQIRELNPNTRIFIKPDELGGGVVSSLWKNKLDLPPGFRYDRRGYLIKGSGDSSEVYPIETKLTSAVDIFHGKDKEFSIKAYSDLVDNPRSSLFDLSKVEIQKTDEQKQQVLNIIDEINARRNARGKEFLYFDDRNIHLIDKELMLEKYPSELGFYVPSEQAIYVRSNIDKLTSLFVLCHELTHLDYFNAVKSDGLKFSNSRLGLRLLKGEKEYFKLGDEAIVHKEGLRLAEYMLENDPIYADVVDKGRGIINEQVGNINRQNKKSFTKERDVKPVNNSDGLCAIVDDNDNKDMARLVANSYSWERESLDKLTKKLGKYLGLPKEEIYDTFLSGAQDGRYLPIARLMESRLGKGSFRKFGEESSTSVGFAKFVREVPKMKRKEDFNKFKLEIGKIKENVKEFAQNTFKKLFGGFQKKTKPTVQ